ncbi:MAG: addiction module protein [Cyanobacteria bacterium J06641_5]
MKAELTQLSPEERAELADFLIQSLETEADNDVELAWDAELERRMQDINRGSATGDAADRVFSKLLERYSWSPSFFTAKQKPN